MDVAGKPGDDCPKADELEEAAAEPCTHALKTAARVTSAAHPKG